MLLVIASEAKQSRFWDCFVGRDESYILLAMTNSYITALLIGTLNDMFSLERLEKKIIIFLLATLLLGVGVIAYKKTCPIGDLRIEHHGIQAETAVEKFSGKININKASAEELTSLKGVGPALSGRIVEYRIKKGLFISISDLKKVPGIGDKLFSKIKDSISLE